MGNVKKILMLVENLSVPADPRVWKEATTLYNHGFAVSVICPKGTTRCRESYACIDGIHIYRYQLPATGNGSMAYMLEYSIALLMTFILSIKVLLRHGFDVIHAANPPDMFFLLGLFYRLFGKKYIFDQHDLAPEMLSVKFQGRMKIVSRLLLVLEWCSYKAAQQVIVTNQSQQGIAMQRGHCLPDKITVVRNGPDLTHLQRVEPDLTLKHGRPYMLAYVGVMGSQDGIEYALKALHHLVYVHGREDISLVLMGDGDSIPILKALTAQLQLDSYVKFTGWLESTELLRYLSTADIGLCPDPQNGLNERSTMIKVMEYMAMHLPIVAFDLAETRFSAQNAALYATPNSIEDFAAKIEQLLQDEPLRHRMGQSGYQRISEELNWNISASNLLQAYSHLIDKM